MEPIVFLEHVCKSYTHVERSPGFFGFFRNLFHPKKKSFQAVSDLSFSIKKGEKVAFIGPNGAGKSTTIKILTGILHPTSGQVRVLSLNPHMHRMELGLRIGAVFGQRSQLWPHLPVMDSFKLLQAIYEIDEADFVKRLRLLSTLFEVESILDKPAKSLSLGQRMRADLVGSLLHEPEILFLDEPTIGLDINGKLAIRKFLNHLTKELGTTLFLTSHDTQDIEEVAQRVIILDKGKMVLDSSLEGLKKRIHKKLVTILSEEPIDVEMPGVDFIAKEPFKSTLEVDLGIVSLEEVIKFVLSNHSIKDITIEDPSLEEIIRDIYGGRI